MMARFYGTVQGNRGMATRLGHAKGGLRVSAQSYSGDINVTLYENDDVDRAYIGVTSHNGNGTVCLYDGPISALLNERKDLIHRMAEEAFRKECAE